MNKGIKIILCSIGALALLVVVAFFILGHFFRKSLEIKIDPEKYSAIVQTRAGWSKNYEFLPEEIPTDAVKIAFFHVPGFLQGSDIISLRLTLPSESIDALVKELAGSDREEISDVSGLGAYAYPPYGMKKPEPNSTFEEVSELPDDFRIFLYKCNLKDLEEHRSPNILSFTAVSTKRNEVVYYIDY